MVYKLELLLNKFDNVNQKRLRNNIYINSNKHIITTNIVYLKHISFFFFLFTLKSNYRI